ncbi:hypothetical protein V5O48_008251 [Marasmius crinis-equi]|uniref:BRCT domain-containing protein n=1 Tax=Marasmius crinis-equi TaxID=585013 RepID=A0ABR3FEH5_9AGAR
MKYNNYNNDNNTESGVYYIVPNRNGPPGSKRIIRRPRAPLTSTPLDDDFDAVTQDRTTMYTAKGRYSWVPTQPPLDDEFDAQTYTNLTGFERIDEVDEDEYDNRRGGLAGYGGREEVEEVDTNTNTRGVEIGDSRNGDTDIPHDRPSSSRDDGYAYHPHHPAGHRARTQPRVQSSLNPTRSRNGHYQPHHSRPYPSDEFASRYVTEREREREAQRTPRPPYVNGSAAAVGESSYQRYGNANANELVRSASRRSSNHHYTNGNAQHIQNHNHTRENGRVYRSEEIIRHSTGDRDRHAHNARSSSRKRRDSSAKPRSRSRSRVRPPSTTPKPQPQQHKPKAITNGPIRPPARQQSYEVIKSRVLEDTPEKTVTISTWRERVADEAGTRSRREYGYVNRENEVEMSIYYVDADDYPVEDGRGRVVEEQVFEKKAPKSGGGRSIARSVVREGEVDWMGSKSPRMVKRALSAAGSRKGKERESQSDLGDDEDVRSYIRDRVQTPWPSMSELGDIDEELEGVEAEGKVLRHQRSQSLPIEWPDSKESDDLGAFHNKSLPRTSTPVRRQRDASGSTAPLEDVKNYAPNRGLASPRAPKSLSLFPTRSNGSTISSIPGPPVSLGTPRPSTSTQPSSVHPLEELLGSCQPPLSHLGPVLLELGIQTEDHLKAVGKMSETTRDRELKQVALKRGVTVFEWAILLDKMCNI